MRSRPRWSTAARATANPEVEVEVGNGQSIEKFKARAHVIDSRVERDRYFEDMSKIWPSFKDYQTRTERLIPIVVLKRQHK
jgi:hypothetical protein